MSATSTCAPYIAPHTLKLGPDGLIYITCENSAVVAVIDRKTHKVVEAIDSGSTNAHRLIIAPDGQRLYTENEEDGAVSVIDLPTRKLIGTIKTPQPARRHRHLRRRQDRGGRLRPGAGAVPDRHRRAKGCATTVPLEGRRQAGADRALRPDFSLLGVTSLNSDTVSLISPSFGEQTAIKVGSQPMDMAFRGDELFVACQGDGSVHVIDIPTRRWKHEASRPAPAASRSDFSDGHRPRRHRRSADRSL